MAQTVGLNVSNPELPGLGKFGIVGTNTNLFQANFTFEVIVDSVIVVAETNIATGVNPAAAYSHYLISIPVEASTGKLLPGVYTINIRAYKTSDSSLLAIYTETFGFNPYGSTRTSSLKIKKETNGTEGFFTLTDESVYRTASDTTVTRSWSVAGPTVAGVPSPTTTGSSTFIKRYFEYVNVTYQVLFKANISYVIANANITVAEAHQLKSDFSYFIDTQNNLCEVKQCLYDTLAGFDASACRLGGFNKLSAADQQKWLALQQYHLGWQVANDCGDTDNRQAFFLKIKKLLKCECPESTDVTAFVLPDGSEQVQTAWEIITTVFIPSFVNFSGLPLRWRIDRDNRLHLIGRIQVPNGLVVSTEYVVTTGWIPTAKVASILPFIKYEVFDVAGKPIGALRVDANSDLLFTPNNQYVGVEFVNINVLIPLDAA